MVKLAIFVLLVRILYIFRVLLIFCVETAIVVDGSILEVAFNRIIAKGSPHLPGFWIDNFFFYGQGRK